MLTRLVSEPKRLGRRCQIRSSANAFPESRSCNQHRRPRQPNRRSECSMREGLLSVPLVLLQPTGPRTHRPHRPGTAWRLCFASHAPTSSPPWSSSPTQMGLTARINGGHVPDPDPNPLASRRHVVPPRVALPSSRGIGNHTHTRTAVSSGSSWLFRRSH